MNVPFALFRTLANYMLWRCVSQSYLRLGRKWRETGHNYAKILTGQDREEPRWEQCLSALTGGLGMALSSLYVKNYFKEDSKKMVFKWLLFRAQN